MPSPWEREWARGRAAGMARAQEAALGTHHRGVLQAAEAEAGAPQSQATASIRTSKLAWTTSESREQENRGVGSADDVVACSS